MMPDLPFMYYTYVIYSIKYDRIYIGQTSNLENRLSCHNSCKVRSTKHYVPWKLVYSEQFPSRSDAMIRELEFKSHKGRDFIRQQLVRVRQLPD